MAKDALLKSRNGVAPTESRLALVTYAGRPDLSESDRLLVNPLARQGVRAVPAIWNDAAVDWEQFDAVALRSCWDYHERPDEFRDWVNRLSGSGVLLINRPRTVIWNMEKTYLRDLASAGVPAVPTVWADSHTSLESTLSRQGWERAVIKPAIGASATGISLVSAAEARQEQHRLDELVARGTAMIQPVVGEIRDGELSLVFFDDQFAYAIRKTPADGSIFVNAAYAGSYAQTEVASDIIERAESVLRAAKQFVGPEAFPYARVDGVLVGSEFVLMELELIEPGLFLDVVPGDAADRFAESIARSMVREGA